MKKLISVVCLSIASVCSAAPPVMETPILGYGTPVTVSISSTTLTKVPTTQTSGRVGIFLNNPTTNAQPVSGFYGNCTSTALAATIRPITISTNTASNFQYFSMREDVCLWLISLDVAAASAPIHYQEVKQ